MISFVALGDTTDASNGLSNEAIDAIETAEARANRRFDCYDEALKQQRAAKSTGDLSAAAAAFRALAEDTVGLSGPEALQVAPLRFAALKNWGLLEERLGQSHNALNAFTQACDLDGSDPGLWYRLAACAAAPTRGEANGAPEGGALTAAAEAGATTNSQRRRGVGGPGSRLRLARFALERALLVQPQHLPSLILCPQVLEALGDHGPSLWEAKQRLAARDPCGTLANARPVVHDGLNPLGVSGDMPAAAVDLSSTFSPSNRGDGGDDGHVIKLRLRDATWAGLGDLLLRAVNSRGPIDGPSDSGDGGQRDDALPAGLLLGWPCVVVELAEAPVSDPLEELCRNITQPIEEKDVSVAVCANLTREDGSSNAGDLSRSSSSNSSNGGGEFGASFTDATQMETTTSEAQGAELVSKDASGALIPQGDAALDVDKQKDEGPSSARRSRRQVERKADELKRVEEDTKRRHDTLKDDVLAPILASLGADGALAGQAINVASLAGKQAGDAFSSQLSAEDSRWWLWPEQKVASPMKEHEIGVTSPLDAAKDDVEMRTTASSRGRRGLNRKIGAVPTKESGSKSEFTEAILSAISAWHTKRKVSAAVVALQERRTVHAFLNRQPPQPLAQWLQVFVSHVGHETTHLSNKLEMDIALALSERQHLSNVNDISGAAGSELSKDIVEMSTIACAVAGWSGVGIAETSTPENEATPAPLRLSSTFLRCVDVVRALAPTPVASDTNGLSGGLGSVQAELLAAELTLQRLAYDISVASSAGKKHKHHDGNTFSLSNESHSGIDSDSLTSAELWARVHGQRRPPQLSHDDENNPNNLNSVKLAAENALWEIDACIARLKLQFDEHISSLEGHKRYASGNAALKTRLALVKASRAFLGHAATLTTAKSNGKTTAASMGGRHDNHNGGLTATVEESQYLAEASAALGPITCLWRPHLLTSANGATAFTVGDSTSKQDSVRNEAPNSTSSRWINGKETTGGVITTLQSLELRRKELEEVDRLPSLRAALTNALFEASPSPMLGNIDDNDEGSRVGNSRGEYSDDDEDRVDFDSIDEFSEEESSFGSEASSSRLSSLGSHSRLSNLHAHSAGMDSSHARLQQLENSSAVRRCCAEALEATLLLTVAEPLTDRVTQSQSQKNATSATNPSFQQQQQQPVLVADALEDLMQHCPQLFPALPQGAAGGSDTAATTGVSGNGSATKPRPGRPPASFNRQEHGMSSHLTPPPLGPPPLAALAALSAERTRRYALGLPLAPPPAHPSPSSSLPIPDGEKAAPPINDLSNAHRASLMGVSSSSSGRSAVDGRCLDEDDEGRRLLRLAGARKAAEKWCEAQANAADPTSVIGCWLHAVTGHDPNLRLPITIQSSSTESSCNISSSGSKAPTAAGLLTFLTTALEHAVSRASNNSTGSARSTSASPQAHEHLAIIEGLLRALAAALWRCSHAHEVPSRASSNPQAPTVGHASAATPRAEADGDDAQLHPACASWAGAAAGTLELPRATIYALAAALLACMKLAAATATQDARDAATSSSSGGSSSNSSISGSVFGVGGARRTVAEAVLEACLAVAYAAPVANIFELPRVLLSSTNSGNDNERTASAQPKGWSLLRAVGRGCLAFACACLQQSDLLSSRHSGVLLLAGPAATALKHAPALTNPATCCEEGIVSNTGKTGVSDDSSGDPETSQRPTPLLAQLADGLARVLALAAHHDDSNAPRPALPAVLALRVPAATALVWLLTPPPPPLPLLPSQPASVTNIRGLKNAAASPLYALFPGFLAPPPTSASRTPLAQLSSSSPSSSAPSSSLTPAARLAVCESLHEFLVADVGLGDPDMSPPLKAAGSGGSGSGSAASPAAGGSSSAAASTGGSDADAHFCSESDAEPLVALFEVVLHDLYSALPAAFPGDYIYSYSGGTHSRGEGQGQDDSDAQLNNSSGSHLPAAQLLLACTLARDLFHLQLLPKLEDNRLRWAAETTSPPTAAASAAVGGASAAANAGGGLVASALLLPSFVKTATSSTALGLLPSKASTINSSSRASPMVHLCAPLAAAPAAGSGALPLPVSVASRLCRLLAPLLAAHDDDCLNVAAAKAPKGGFPPDWLELVPKAGGFSKVQMDDQLRLLDAVFRTDAFWWLPPQQTTTTRQTTSRVSTSASLSYLFDDLTLSRAERAARELAQAGTPVNNNVDKASVRGSSARNATDASITDDSPDIAFIDDDIDGSHAAWMHALRPELYRLFVERKSLAVFGSGKRPDSSSEHARAEHEAIVVCRAGLHALVLNPTSHESWWALGNAYEHLLRLVSDAFDASIDQAVGLSPAATHVATSALLKLMAQRHGAGCPSWSPSPSLSFTGATCSSGESSSQVGGSGYRYYQRMGRGASAAAAVGASAVLLYGDRMHVDPAPALGVWRDLLEPFLSDGGGSGTTGNTGSGLDHAWSSGGAWASEEIDRATVIEIQGLAARLGLQQQRQLQQQMAASSKTTAAAAAAANPTLPDASGDAMDECGPAGDSTMGFEPSTNTAAANTAPVTIVAADAAPTPSPDASLIRPQDALAALFAHAYRALCGRCYAAAAAAYARGARLSWQPPPVMPLLPTPNIWFTPATEISEWAHLENSRATTDQPFGWLVPSESSTLQLNQPAATAPRPWFCPPPDGVGGPQLLHLVRALEALSFHMYGARQALPKPPAPTPDAHAPAEGGRREWFTSHAHFAWPPPLPEDAESASSSSSPSSSTADAPAPNTPWVGAVGMPDGGRSVTCASAEAGPAWGHLRTAKAKEVLDLLNVVDAITRPSPGSVAASAAETTTSSRLMAPSAAIDDASGEESSSKGGAYGGAQSPTYQVGDKVEARWLSGDLFYPATVVAVHAPSPQNSADLGEGMRNREELLHSSEASTSYDLLYDDKEAESSVQLHLMRRPNPRAQCLPLRPWGCALLRAKLQLKLLGKVAAFPTESEAAGGASTGAVSAASGGGGEMMDTAGEAETAVSAAAADEKEASFTKEVLESYQEVLAACAGTPPVNTAAISASSPTSPRARGASAGASATAAGITEDQEVLERASSSFGQAGLGGLPKESMKIGALSTAGYDALCLLHCARAKVVSRWLRIATPPPLGVLDQLERFNFHLVNAQHVRGPTPTTASGDGNATTSSSGEASASTTDGFVSSSSSSSAAASAESRSSTSGQTISCFEAGSIGQRLESVLKDCIRALVHVLKALPYHHRAIAGLAHMYAEKRRCQAVCGPKAQLTFQIGPPPLSLKAAATAGKSQRAPGPEELSLESSANTTDLKQDSASLREAWKLAQFLFQEWGLEVRVESHSCSDNSESKLPTLRIKHFRSLDPEATAMKAMDTELGNEFGGGEIGRHAGNSSSRTGPSGASIDSLASFPLLQLSDALAVCSAAFPDKRAKAAKGRLKLRKPSARPAAASWLQPLMPATAINKPPVVYAGASRRQALDSSPVFGFGLGLGEVRSLLQSSSASSLHPDRRSTPSGGGSGEGTMHDNADNAHSPGPSVLKTWLDHCPMPGDELVSVGGVHLATWFRAHEAYASHSTGDPSTANAKTTDANAAAVAGTADLAFPADHTNAAFPIVVTKWEAGFKFNFDFVKMTSPEGTPEGVKVSSFEEVPSQDSMNNDDDDFVDGSAARRVQMVRHPALAQGLQVGDVLVGIGEAGTADSGAPIAAAMDLTVETSGASSQSTPRSFTRVEHLPHETIVESLESLHLGRHALWFWRPPRASSSASNPPLGEQPPPLLPDPFPLAAGRALMLSVERRSPHGNRCSAFAAPPALTESKKPQPPSPLPASLEPLSQNAEAEVTANEGDDDDEEEEISDVATQRMSLADSIRGHHGISEDQGDGDRENDRDATAGRDVSSSKDPGEYSDNSGLSDLDNDDDYDNTANGVDTATQATAAAQSSETERPEQEKESAGEGELTTTTTTSVAESRRARQCRKEQSASKKSSSSNSAAKGGAATSSGGGSMSASAAASAAAAKEAEIEMALWPGTGGCADVDLLRRRGNQEAGKWLEKLLAKRLPQVVAIWVPETATSSWEASVVRTRAFDRLRIKYAAHFAAVFTQDLAADPPPMLSAGVSGSRRASGAVVAAAHSAWMSKSKDLLERAAGHCAAVKPTRRDRTNQILEADLLNAAASAHLAHAVHALAHRHRAQGSHQHSAGGSGSGGGGCSGKGSSSSSSSINGGLLSAGAVSSLLSLAFDRYLHVTETLLDGAPSEPTTEGIVASAMSKAPHQHGRIGLEGRCAALVTAAATLSRAHLAPPPSSTGKAKAAAAAAAPLPALPSPSPRPTSLVVAASLTSPRATSTKGASESIPVFANATAAAPPAPQESPTKKNTASSTVVASVTGASSTVADTMKTPATATATAKSAVPAAKTTTSKTATKPAAAAPASSPSSFSSLSSSRKARALAKVQACMALHGIPWYAPAAPLPPVAAPKAYKRPRSPLQAEAPSQQPPFTGAEVDPSTKPSADLSVDLSTDEPRAKSPRTTQAASTDAENGSGAEKRPAEAKNATTDSTAASDAAIVANDEAAPPVKRRRFTIAEERILASAVASVDSTSAADESGSSPRTELSWESVREACAASGAESLAGKWSAAELRDKWKKLKVKLAAKQEQVAAEQKKFQEQQQEQAQQSVQLEGASSQGAEAPSTGHTEADANAGSTRPPGT